MAMVKKFLTENWLFLLFLLAIVSAFVLLRTSPTQLASAAEFDQTINNGEPTIVEFYSNY